MQQNIASNNLSALNRFVLFHPNTDGRCGRAVFINPYLLQRFAELVDTDSAAGRATAKQIIDLRAQAAGLNSSTNQGKPSTHRQTLGSLVVYYSVVQAGTENSHGAGVYITDLKRSCGKGEGDAAGLYLSKFSRGKRNDWRPQKISASKLPTLVGAIGGLVKGQDYDLKLTAGRCGQYLASKVKASQLNNAFSLYYTPGFVIDGLGSWITPEQKIDSDDAGPKQLAQLLINTQQQYWGASDLPPHQWYVFGDGAKFLLQTLRQVKQLGGEGLAMHQFHFVAPKENLGLLLGELRQLDAQVSNQVHELGDSFAVQLHQLGSDGSGADAVVSGLQGYNKSWNKLDSAMQPGVKLLQQFAQRLNNPLEVYFSDLIKQMGQTLKGGW